VVGTLERRIDASVDWTLLSEMDTLGLDEIALKKGQRNYVTLVTGRFRDGEIVRLGVLPGHEKAEVVGGNHQLLHPSREHWLCRRFQQQDQSPQATLLWHSQPQALVPAYLPGLAWLLFIRSYHHICLNHANY
jgi:hypothetical protein